MIRYDRCPISMIMYLHDDDDDDDTKICSHEDDEDDWEDKGGCKEAHVEACKIF